MTAMMRLSPTRCRCPKSSAQMQRSECWFAGECQSARCTEVACTSVPRSAVSRRLELGLGQDEVSERGVLTASDGLCKSPYDALASVHYGRRRTTGWLGLGSRIGQGFP